MPRRARRSAASPLPPAPRPVFLAAAGGAVLGLALARLLFDFTPWRFEALGTLPGALGLAALGAVAAFALVRFARTASNPALWAPFALLLVTLLSPTVNPLRDVTLLLGALALAALLLTQTSRPSTRLFPLFLFLFLFSLYLAILAPAVGEADTFEFQVGIARLGIAHGSGYPLLMLVGKLFTLLPLGGTLAWRANLTSAFFGALAAVCVERLSRRLGASALPALLAGLAFGVAPTLWSRAVEVEAYTLNAALIAGLLLLCLRLIAPPPAPSRLQNALALLFGLSLTNHLTTLLLAPAVALSAARAAWFSLRDLASPRARFSGALTVALRLGAFGLLGLSVYLYLPLRWPAVNHGELLSLGQFINILSGNEAKGAFQWTLPLRDLGRYAIVGGKLLGEFGWPGLVLGMLGLGSLIVTAVRRRAWLSAPLILLLAYLPYLYFALAFNVPDPDFSAFFIPLHLMLAALLGVGLQTLLNALTSPRLAPALARAAPLAAGLIVTASALLPLASIWRNLPLVSQAGDWERQRYGELMLRQPLAPHAAILADSQKIAPLYYLQVAEGRRPDLDILVLPDEASYRAVLDERLAAGQTVYLGRYLPGLGAGYSLRSVGPLAEVSPTPLTTNTLPLTPPAGQLAAANITLLGVVDDPAEPRAAAAPNPLNVTLVWQAAATPSANLLVSLRLVDNTSGGVQWQSAGSVPVSGLYPTNAWRPGEIITDFYAVPIAPTLAPGGYRLEVGLFPPFAATDTGWVGVTDVTILPPAAAPHPAHLLRARVGNAWLLGYDLPASAAPGARVPVTLYWWRDATATAVTALGETRSLAAWPLGALVPQVYDLTAPTSGDAWTIDLGAPALSRCGWLRAETASCALPPARLAGEAAAEGAYNFADLLLLRAVDLATPAAAPGGLVDVTLTWQGLQALPEDYTVFVHLLGPDGLVHGQADAWPVSGTRATSGWSPGEIIRDPYTLRVPDDAPPGDYQVEIGLYLLATNERLAVLNADGAPIDDRVLVPGPTIGP